MRALTILLLSLLIHTASHAAAEIKFSNDEWDFGTIKEEGGTVSHSFTFVNTGDTPLVILRVSTTCGCTSPDYSQKPIPAGGSSEITITFDPEYRPGVFTKSIEVRSSAATKPIELTIKGEVTPRELSLAEKFPYEVGAGLLASRLYIAIGQIDHEEYRKSMIELHNPTPRDIKLDINPTLKSGYLKYKAPKTIKAGKTEELHAGYLVEAKSGYYGKLNDELQFIVNDKPSSMILKIRAFTSPKADE